MASVGSDLIGRIKGVWNGLSRTMQWLTGGLLVALLLSLGLTWYLQRPQWEVFFRANDPSEVTTLVERLDELKVQNRLTGDGLTIMVPSKERSAANLAKAQAGLPSGGHVGLEIFAEPQFGATEFDKKVQYKRALEGELAKSLMRIADIQYAKVNLNLPEKSVFVRDREMPSASVIVQPRAGRSLSKENVVAVVKFVANSVEGLTPERVTLINDKGIVLHADLELDQSTGVDAELLAQQRLREQQLADKVLSILEPIFGMGQVAASVTVEYDHQTSRTEEKILGQGVPVVTSTERSSSQTQGTTAATPAVVDPTAPPAGTATPPPIYQQQQTQQSSGDSFTSKSQTQFEVGEKSSVVVTPAGGVKRVSTAVTINREELTIGQVDQIRQLAANATGATLADVSVLAMSFNLAHEVVPLPAARPSLLDPRTLAIGLGLASFLLLVAALLTRRRRAEAEFALPGLPGYPAAGTTLDVALGLDQPTVARHQVAATTMDAGGTDESDEAPSTVAQKLEEVLKNRKPPRQPVDPEDFMDDDILVDIDVLIDQAPEASAEVIRQWLKGGI